MKKRTVLGLMSAFLLMCISSASAQNELQTVIIKVVESTIKPQIITVKPEGTIESTPLGKVNINSGNARIYDDNLLVLQSEINKWKKEGFKVDGVSHSVYADNQFTVVVMSKGDKE